ncbi:LxmA leader domain family RiPP [Streptomyces sp. NPDC046727]
MMNETAELATGFDAYTDLDELAAAVEASTEAKTPGFSITPTFTLTHQH